MTGCAPASGDDAAPTLEVVRAATEKYRDVGAALADGYLRDELDTCETPYHMGLVGKAGAMGIHFLRPDLLGIDSLETRFDVAASHIDFLHPAILLYEPQADGSLDLVAVANMVSAEAWESRGQRSPPTFGGLPYDYVPANPGMGTGAFYERHLWLFRENPDGVYAQYNPNVTCKHHEYVMPMVHPPGTTM
jgi:hypothetical protein